MPNEKTEARQINFLTDNFDVHVDHIRKGQERRFEILRYAFVGYFAYFAFLFSAASKQFLCVIPFESMVLIPSFLMFQGVMYIWIINMNIAKHGAYIGYLFEHGLSRYGIGPNYYQEFLKTTYHRKSGALSIFAHSSLHYSQLVLFVMMLASCALYFYVENSGGVATFAQCGLEGGSQK